VPAYSRHYNYSPEQVPSNQIAHLREALATTRTLSTEPLHAI